MRQFLLFCILSVASSCWGAEESHISATVKEVIVHSKSELINGQKHESQLLLLKLEDGREVEALNPIPVGTPYRIILKKSDRVLVHEEEGVFFIEGYQMDHVCWVLFAIFAFLILLVGRKKGVFTLVSLGLKGSLLMLVIVPAIKSGRSPILMASIFSVLATILTITFVSGFNRKSLAACVGSIGGVAVAGLIGYWAVSSAHVTGLLKTETQSLYHQFPQIKIMQLIPAGVLIGSLGATMDVAISIASSLLEIHIAAPHKKFLELYKIGINIGQDVMGTMINTLILAYAGGALATVLLISELDWRFLLNTEMIMEEIILAIVGSIGLILAIPLTALIGSYLYTSQKLPLHEKSDS